MNPTKDQIIARLLDPGVIAVIRLKSPAVAEPLVDALFVGGIVAIEITLTTPGALGLIESLSQRLALRGLVGVGSVLDAASAQAAIQAGAQFVVSPVTKPEIVVAAHALGKPVMLGAVTPTEAQAAHEAGADFVKLFPADSLGPGYVRSLLAPLPHLRIVPTGGVGVNNVAQFMKAGCVAVGVGSSLLRQDLIEAQKWGELAELASEFVRRTHAASCVPTS